jgi:flavin-dependent dehydrogenase
MYDVIIIGAGFAGLTLALHLPENLKVLLIEKKENLDDLYESTGLITRTTKELIQGYFPDLPDYLSNDIDTLGLISSNFRDHFFSKAASPWIYSTQTGKLVKAMSEELNDNVDLIRSARFIKLEETPKGISVEVNYKDRREVFNGKFLTGADGGRSRVASCANLSQNENYLYGYEKTYIGNITFGFTPQTTVYHYWFGEFSLGYGGWLSPTKIGSKSAFRIGLAKLDNGVRDLNKLDCFVKKLEDLNQIEIVNEIDSYVGAIPIGGPLSNTYNEKVALVGDAAGYCGPFAADGIKGAVVSGIVLARLLPQYLKNGDIKVLDNLSKEMNKYGNLMKYFRTQKLYRWVWNQMKRNKTFYDLYKVIEQDKNLFIEQFSDSKDKGSGLFKILMKPRLIPYLINYGLSWLVDCLFIK